ncbi:Eukaryotic translation initiation factor 3 subunit M [Mycena chlorophos]|uniref:Eukaryotic translation initiation factor 3 subunit M n=1 Tax=Mycena chlorophos TaxID=658473 RepID=A0A8H6W1A7_MYCCL|nr:Eukaryotic translation initiation factor 3 subunit M [Mycena chlorophos]
MFISGQNDDFDPITDRPSVGLLSEEPGAETGQSYYDYLLSIRKELPPTTWKNLLEPRRAECLHSVRCPRRDGPRVPCCPAPLGDVLVLRLLLLRYWSCGSSPSLPPVSSKALLTGGLVAIVRAHHRYTDAKLDPYNAKEGFPIGTADLSDSRKNSIVQSQHKYYVVFLPLAVFAVVPQDKVIGRGFREGNRGLLQPNKRTSAIPLRPRLVKIKGSSSTGCSPTSSTRYHGNLRSVSLDLAIANEELEALQLTRTDVEKWSKRSQTRTKNLGNAYEYSIAYVRSLTPGSSSANTAAVELISMALRLPLVFDFDPLFKVEAVGLGARATDMHTFNEWKASHPDAIAKHLPYPAPPELDAAQLLTLGFQNIGQDLAYAKIAEALQARSTEVGKWVIDGTHPHRPASGKLSQTSQTLHITRAKARSFECEQWETLERGLFAWKTGIAGVPDVVALARKQAAAPMLQNGTRR